MRQATSRRTGFHHRKHDRQLSWRQQSDAHQPYPSPATHPHRHIFHFRVSIDVFHDDRELEFIQFKRWLENLYSGKVLELNYKSCEMIADDLYLQIAEKYPDRDVHIEVSEDGENGCYVEYNCTRPYQTVTV